MGEEADYLSSQSDDGAADDFDELQQQRYYDNINTMKLRYTDNKRSAINTTIRCACCNKRILKSNYQTQFCSNKGRGNCKDTYWNSVNDKRRTRAKFFSTR